MTLPKKRRRNIVVDKVLYHWLRNWETRRQSTTAIQLGSGIGSMLRARVDGELKPADVEGAIRFAIQTGWNPMSRDGMEIAIDARDTPTNYRLVPEFRNRALRRRWLRISNLLQHAKYVLSKNTDSLNVTQFYEYLDHNELELALDELSRMGQGCTCIAGFWRNLERAAEEMELQQKVLGFRDRIRKIEDNTTN